MSMLDRRLTEVPVAILDFETTGLSPKAGSRVVEVAVVRCEPGSDPVVALDTLLDPQGPVLCSRIHGIHEDDVVGAPLFSDIADDLVRSLEGSIVGAFNASFDLAFYLAEMGYFRRGQAVRTPPHLCMMWLRPLLGIGKRCSLSAACQSLSLADTSHRAAEDALATAYLWRHYVDMAGAKGIQTIRDLQKAGTHGYLNSLELAPYTAVDLSRLGAERSTTALKPRFDPIRDPRRGTAQAQARPMDPATAIHAYWHALCGAYSDGHFSDEELTSLREEQGRLGLPIPTIRAVHARFLADRLALAAEDDAVTSAESTVLGRLHVALGELGWAPGRD